MIHRSGVNHAAFALSRIARRSGYGCPLNQPPPATIVTENGDVPLDGDWPQQHE
jgi:hypothetical protein